MKIIFRGHAVQRMFERGLTIEDVRAVLADGETIVVTAYEPDPGVWEADFRRKKP